MRVRQATARELVAWSAPKFRMPPRRGIPGPVYPFPPSYEIRKCWGGCPNCDFNVCCGYIPFEGVPIPYGTLQDALDRYNRLDRPVDD